MKYGCVTDISLVITSGIVIIRPQKVRGARDEFMNHQGSESSFEHLSEITSYRCIGQFSSALLNFGVRWLSQRPHNSR